MELFSNGSQETVEAELCVLILYLPQTNSSVIYVIGLTIFMYFNSNHKASFFSSKSEIARFLQEKMNFTEINNFLNLKGTTLVFVIKNQ